MVTMPTDPDSNPLVEEAAALNRTGEDSDIVAEIEALGRAEAEAAEAPPPTPPPAAAPGAQAAPPAPPVPTPPPDAALLQRQLQETQERLRRYETQEQEAALDREVAQYRGQLEVQGFTEEQAAQLAQQTKQQYQREMQLQEATRLRELNSLGKFYASLHFAKKHGVDPAELLRYDSPQQMETAARTQAELKALKEQVQRLTQREVPPSTYETGQVSPAGERSEAGWLTAYNNGDRSPKAQAAARKAAGL